jgi:hypothetical protein
MTTSQFMTQVKTVGLVGLTAVILAGCTAGGTSSTPKVDSGSQDALEKPAEKVGTTTISGKLTQTGEQFFITVAGKPPQEISSYKLDFAPFVGKTVKVSGQFSGNTLFVSQIE